ncbi:DUF2303 family protein [Tistrella bauzanensis]|uniref:DUF2303 family protein n=1 Tax=Tistrella TaxID=171436 RepID=UPI0031F6C4CE
MADDTIIQGDALTIPGNVAEIAALQEDISNRRLLSLDSPDLLAQAQMIVLKGAGGSDTLTSLKRYRDEVAAAPLRLKGWTTLTTVGSLIAHILRYRQPDTTLYASVDADGLTASLTAIYNEAGRHGYEPDLSADDDQQAALRKMIGATALVAPADAPVFAGWGDHTVSYPYPVSPEWTAWYKLHKRCRAALDGTGQGLTQEDLAEWLSDHAMDWAMVDGQTSDPMIDDWVASLASQGAAIAKPSQLMALSRGLTINVDTKVTSGVRLETGEVQLTYETEHKGPAGGTLTMPRYAVIRIPVFDHDPMMRHIGVDIRYRIAGGNIRWYLLLHRPDMAFVLAARATAQRAAEATGVPLYYGAPPQASARV